MRLRKLREGRRPVKSQHVTSQLCGLSRDALRRYEREEAEPRLDALVAIAEYYGVTVDFLLGREEKNL